MIPEHARRDSSVKPQQTVPKGGTSQADLTMRLGSTSQAIEWLLHAAERLGGLSWLTPRTRVVLNSNNGGLSVWWCGGHTRPVKQNKKGPRTDRSHQGSGAHVSQASSIFPGLPRKRHHTDTVAYEVPEDMVLRSRLMLPSMSQADTLNALGLEARRLSPFPAEDLVWGAEKEEFAPEDLSMAASSAGHSGITRNHMPAWIIVMASRKQLSRWLQDRHTGSFDAAAELWVVTGVQQPVCLPGFGEGRRLQAQARGRLLGMSLFASAAVLAGVIAITPTLQLRSVALEAGFSFEDIAKKSASASAQRDAAVKSISELTALRELTVQSLEPSALLAKITELLPNNTHVQSLSAALAATDPAGSTKVTVTGQTENTAELMQRLSAVDGVTAVKAPVPGNRPPGASKEVFTIEFVLRPTTGSGVMSATHVTSPITSQPVADPLSTAAPGAGTSAPTPLLPTPYKPANSNPANARNGLSGFTIGVQPPVTAPKNVASTPQSAALPTGSASISTAAGAAGAAHAASTAQASASASAPAAPVSSPNTEPRGGRGGLAR